MEMKMYRKPKPGFYISGGIVTGLSLVVLLALLASGEYDTDSLLAVFTFFVLGLCLLGGGIAVSASAKKHNNNLIKTQGRSAGLECPACKYKISVDVSSFLPHRNFPEGFVYCPACKKPLSIRLFKPEDKEIIQDNSEQQ